MEYSMSAKIRSIFLISIFLSVFLSGCGPTKMHHEPPKPKLKESVSKYLKSNGVIPVNVYVNVSRDRVYASLDHEGYSANWKEKPKEDSVVNWRKVRVGMGGLLGVAMGDDDCSNGCILTGPLEEFDSIEEVKIRDKIFKKLSEIELATEQFEINKVILEKPVNGYERQNHVMEIVNELQEDEGAIFIDIRHFLSPEFDSIVFSSSIELYTRQSMSSDNFEYKKRKNDSIVDVNVFEGYIPIQTKWVSFVSNLIEEDSDESFLIDMWANNNGELLNKTLESGSQKIVDLISLSFDEKRRLDKKFNPHKGCIWMTLIDNFPEKCYMNGSLHKLADNRALTVFDDGAFLFELPLDSL